MKVWALKCLASLMEEDIWHQKKIYTGDLKKNFAPSEERYGNIKDTSTMENPLAATHMGLIYVNPEGVMAILILKLLRYTSEKLCENGNE